MTGAHCIKSISCGPFVKNERISRLIYSFGIPLQVLWRKLMKREMCRKAIGFRLRIHTHNPSEKEFVFVACWQRLCLLSPSHKSQHAKPQNYEQWIFVRVISIDSWFWRVGAASSCSKIVSISMKAASEMKTKQILIIWTSNERCGS